MDELRSTIFSASLRRLLNETLQPGERVLWQDQPDGVSRMMMWRFLWWIGFPWLLVTAIAISRGWIDQSIMPLLMSGAMMIAAPFVMLLYDLQTLCAITDRRALIVRTAWGKRTVKATSFEDMDAALETSDIGRGAGHLNFASGISTRSPGRYGFRCIRNPSRVRDILEHARRRTPSRSGIDNGSIRHRGDEFPEAKNGREPLKLHSLATKLHALAIKADQDSCLSQGQGHDQGLHHCCYAPGTGALRRACAARG